MILDTLAALSQNHNNVHVENPSIDEIFNTLVDLEQHGFINFDYEFLTIRGETVLNAKIQEWKYVIKDMILRRYGSKYIQNYIIDELAYRIELYKQGIVYDEYTELNAGLPDPFGIGGFEFSEDEFEFSGDFPYSLNLRFDAPDSRDYSFSSSLMKDDRVTNVPNSFDYTNEMTSVKSQNKLASCVGFACCSMKEWQELKEYFKENNPKYAFKSQFKDLSEQWVYYMSKKIDPWPNQEGTSIRCAMKVLHKIGVPNEKGWPYNDLIKGNPENWAHLVARWTVISSYERIKTLDQMKAALYENGPLVAGMLCFKGILSVGSDGIVPMPIDNEKPIGGHAICIVGYDDEKQLVKFKNSWSGSWGNNGYGLISYQYLPYVIDVWVAKDMHVTYEMMKGAKPFFGK